MHFQNKSGVYYMQNIYTLLDFANDSCVYFTTKSKNHQNKIYDN